MSLTGVPTARQEPFDAIPLSVQQHPDLTGNPKRLYAALCSAQRTGRQPTYAELADRLAASTRSIVRWVAQLAAAGLIAVRRRGQGRPNLLTVLGLVTSAGDRRPAAATTAWQPAPASPLKKRTDGRTGGYTQANVDPVAFTGGRYGAWIHT